MRGERMSYLGAPLMSNKQDWGTPRAFFEYVEKKFNLTFTLDACASNHNYKVKKYFTEQDDALSLKWCFAHENGHTFEEVWLNPPFGKGGKLQRQFIDHAVKQAKLQYCRVFALIPARTDTRLFHEIIIPNASYVYFIKGRLNHEHDDRTPRGSSPFPSMLCVFEGRGKLCEMDVLKPTKQERGF